MATATRRRHDAAATARRVAEARAMAHARRRGRWIVVTSSVVVLLVAAALVVAGVISTGNRHPAAGSVPRVPAPASVVTAVTGLPLTLTDAIGAGTSHPAPMSVPPSGTLTGPSGRPEVLYVGGEYCPYCAAERWALVQALSRFGTFDNLSLTRSASDDVFPNTPTFTFYGASYQSRYIDFVGRELFTNEPQGRFYRPLEKLTLAEQQIFAPYNRFPFLDVGGKLATTGVTFEPKVLDGLTAAQIANALSDRTSPVAQAVVGSANRLTAEICSVTGQQPASVCTAKGVRDAAAPH